MGLLGIIPEYLLVRVLLREVRSADFYEDHISLKSRNLKGNISYVELANVSPARKGSRNVGILLEVKGRKPALKLFSNPESTELKTDLYSWLNEKMHRSAA